MTHKSNANILVIDDNLNDLKLVSQILTEAGYIVRPASAGLLGMRSANSAPPDLILLDINLPDVNGVEVCRLLRASEKTQDIPIVFLSAIDANELKVVALQAGGNDYVTKPIQPKMLLDRVKTHIGLKELKRKVYAQEEKFRLTFDLAPVGIAHVDADGHWLEINKYLLNMLGYTQEDLRKLDFQTITHPDDLYDDMELINQLLAGKIASYSMQKRYLHQQGHFIWGKLTAGMVANEDGTPNYLIKIIEDITTSKEEGQ